MGVKTYFTERPFVIKWGLKPTLLNARKEEEEFLLVNKTANRSILQDFLMNISKGISKLNLA